MTHFFLQRGEKFRWARKWWCITAIERTAYPRFTRAPSVKELHEIYTPMPTDAAFVSTHARGPAQKLALMVLLKVYQRLDYFPDPQIIPAAVISHIRTVMKYPSDLVPDIAPATLYRYYAAIREYLEVKLGSLQKSITAHFCSTCGKSLLAKQPGV